MAKATHKIIDVGWSYRLTPGPTRLVLASQADKKNWPPDELLILDGKKGEFGLLRTNHPNFTRYENAAVNFVKKSLAERSLIVMPELSGSLSIEMRIRELVDKSKKRCVVVGGSYYRVSPDTKRVEHVCPILLPDHETYYQQKFFPAPIEDPGFDPPERRVVLVFRNTGFGDFAVLVCSDALENDSRMEYVNKLRHQIDFLVVPSRNADPQLPNSLQVLSNSERWCILYCNGHRTIPSKVISSYKSASGKQPEAVDGIATIDLPQFQTDLQNRDGLHKSTEVERYFESRPRHWPYRRMRASGFSDHLRVLAIGSHFDDVWLGCSGALMRLRECYEAQIRVVTLCNVYRSPYYDRYELKGATLDKLHEDIENLCRELGFRHELNREPDLGLDDQSFAEDKVRTYMKRLAERAGHTDLLFVPRQDDEVHRDHMLAAKAAIVAFRGANVFEYEIKDFRRSPFKPNLLVDVGIKSNRPITLRDDKRFGNISFAEKKAFILENAFRVMDKKDLPPVVQRDHTLGRMAFRASQSGTDLRYAEAFVAEMTI
ncbi:MAG TPA: PIG-L family deacetylase [Pyrinomonadaceae bacterium]|nr:PIG-L family deacetylase [Pyrinomonadaceae bacterium]